jgi:hypothetical protein
MKTRILVAATAAAIASALLPLQSASAGPVEREAVHTAQWGIRQAHALAETAVCDVEVSAGGVSVLSATCDGVREGAELVVNVVEGRVENTRQTVRDAACPLEVSVAGIRIVSVDCDGLEAGIEMVRSIVEGRSQEVIAAAHEARATADDAVMAYCDKDCRAAQRDLAKAVRDARKELDPTVRDLRRTLADA